MVTITIQFPTIAEALKYLRDTSPKEAQLRAETTSGIFKTINVVDAEPGTRLPLNHGPTGNTPEMLGHALDQNVPDEAEEPTPEMLAALEPPATSPETVLELASAVSKAHGVPAVREILSKLGVSRLSELNTAGRDTFRELAGALLK